MPRKRLSTIRAHRTFALKIIARSRERLNLTRVTLAGAFGAQGSEVSFPVVAGSSLSSELAS